MKVLNSNLHTRSGLPHVVKLIIINFCQLEKNVKKCYNIGFAAIKMIFLFGYTINFGVLIKYVSTQFTKVQ